MDFYLFLNKDFSLILSPILTILVSLDSLFNQISMDI